MSFDNSTSPFDHAPIRTTQHKYPQLRSAIYRTLASRRRRSCFLTFLLVETRNGAPKGGGWVLRAFVLLLRLRRMEVLRVQEDNHGSSSLSTSLRAHRY